MYSSFMFGKYIAGSVQNMEVNTATTAFSLTIE